ncbi:MAG: GDSL-type esterase/lipase family protein, partial [Ruthenibacterium sp.]
NLSGDGVFVKFSNYSCARPEWVGHATIALADAKGNLLGGTLCPLTVHGDASFAIVPQRDVFSDFIRMPVAPGCLIAVSLYYPAADKIVSGNFVGLFAARSLKGDFCTQSVLPKSKLLSGLSRSMLPWDITSATTTLSEVIVRQHDDAPRPRVLAAFGDSIMQQGAWVTPFTARLYARFPGEISVCNLGIGGNRLLHDSPPGVKGIYGQKGMDRYIYSLLCIEGLTHAIIALGTNDIGLPGKDGAPDSELITLKQYAEALTDMVIQLRKRGIKVYAGHLLPREINAVYTADREQLRRAMNGWLDSCNLFDAVLKLDEPVADNVDGIGMKKEFSLPDRLHPNLAGGRAIADSINLDLFA